jgi:hypothetical protein
MSKYFRFTPSQNDYTTLRFIDRGVFNGLTIKQFDANVIAISGDDVELSELLSEQPVEIDLTEITFEEFLPLAMKSNQGKFQLEQLDTELKNAIDEINEYASDREMMTWGKQEQEARALVADPIAVTPMIDGLVVARGLGETREQLAQKIIMAADYKAGLIADCLGKYQVKRRELFA